MSKYVHHSLALTEKEQVKLDAVKKSTGFGVKKIFMAMVDALMPTRIGIDDTQGDGKNKSAIILNVPSEKSPEASIIEEE